MEVLGLSNHYLKQCGFHIIEFVLFVAPSIPDSLSVRFGILSVYFITHYYKGQVAYGNYKKKCLTEMKSSIV
jgi:hypothetical protein